MVDQVVTPAVQTPWTARLRHFLSLSVVFDTVIALVYISVSIAFVAGPPSPRDSSAAIYFKSIPLSLLTVRMLCWVVCVYQRVVCTAGVVADDTEIMRVNALFDISALFAVIMQLIGDCVIETVTESAPSLFACAFMFSISNVLFALCIARTTIRSIALVPRKPMLIIFGSCGGLCLVWFLTAVISLVVGGHGFIIALVATVSLSAPTAAVACSAAAIYVYRERKIGSFPRIVLAAAGALFALLNTAVFVFAAAAGTMQSSWYPGVELTFHWLSVLLLCYALTPNDGYSVEALSVFFAYLSFPLAAASSLVDGRHHIYASATLAATTTATADPPLLSETKV